MNKEPAHQCIDKTELLAQTKAKIEQYGLQVITVEGSDYSPSFAYSIGLFETYRQPEIICFGLPQKVGHVIINDVANLMRQGESIKSYSNYDNIFKNGRAEFLPVDDRNISDYFGVAGLHYASANFPALQLVWTDRNGRFPWEEDFETEYLYDQPLLDRNADFKFREAKNLGVFTTRQWLDLDKPILRVVHDTDGDWQFLTGDQLPEDLRLVALETIVMKDQTLNEVFDLDYGYSMERDEIGGEWTRAKLEAEGEEG